jgi:prepilin-type N-terminal cleavage/methylation domain-containing protein
MRSVRSGERGFTLVEVLVAMLVLAAAAASTAVLFAATTASTRHARNQTWSAMLAMDKMEQLRALAWRYGANGAPVSDMTTDLSVDPPSSGGPGLATAGADVLERNATGYVDYLDGAGRWVGTGITAPPTATYLRRWSVEPLSPSLPDTLLLQVLVTTVVPAADRVLLVTVRTRKVG